MENNILSVQKKLKRLFFMTCVFFILIYICGEYLLTADPLLESVSVQTKYVVSVVMILVTLAIIPCTLRLFKFQFAKNKIRANGMDMFSLLLALRIFLLSDAVFINMFLYYLFGCEPTYGYLTVITLLTLPFVYPSKDKIQAIWDDVMPSTEEAIEE